MLVVAPATVAPPIALSSPGPVPVHADDAGLADPSQTQENLDRVGNFTVGPGPGAVIGFSCAPMSRLVLAAKTNASERTKRVIDTPQL